MKKTISTILILSALAAPLSGSACFADTPKINTGFIETAISGLKALRLTPYSSSNDKCKFSIDDGAQELKSNTCDNMLKYAILHLKPFNKIAKSCSVDVDGTSKLPGDNDINNLINFASNYHLNLDEAAKAFTVKDETNNSVSFVPYDVMCKSVEFSKAFKSSLANAASAINAFGYSEAQKLANFAESENLSFDDIKKLYDETSKYHNETYKCHYNYHIDDFFLDLENYSKSAKKFNLTLKDIIDVYKGHTMSPNLKDLNEFLKAAGYLKFSHPQLFK